jgi:NADH:ubiquinone oxidoreductase subunit 6 (subunit J)
MLSLFTEMQLYGVNFLFVLMLLTSIMIALQNNPVYAVFSFILTALMVCVCFLLLGAEFFALLILVVYTGVITVLFLFVVIMYNLREMLVSLRGVFYHPFFFCVLYKLY